MCNRYRLTAKQTEMAATFGIRTPYEVDETFPTGDIFPTGKKTQFYGTVILQDGESRRSERLADRRQPARRLLVYRSEQLKLYSYRQRI